MKIGIMSMQRIRNYGSFLQAYGLKRIIESLGHNVEFVDYEYEKTIIEPQRRNIIKKIFNNINVINYIKKKKVIKSYNNKFDNEFIPLLCKKNYNIRPKNIDELVIGSDEVFNCLQEYPVGYSKELFGKNYENIPVISYAASFGQTNIERLREYKIDGEVGQLLKKFKNISVRDKNSYETIRLLTGKNPCLNLDPVLIYDFDDETIDNVKIKDYIIVYAYPGRLSKEEEKQIKKFAKKHNKKILSFGMYQRISDYEKVVHPFELFEYFKKADFIITDTFHGSIFSIKTHSNFCTIVRNSKNGNSNKLIDLLNRLNQKERIISNIEELEEIYTKKTQYEITDKIIKEEQRKAINYLKDSFR